MNKNQFIQAIRNKKKIRLTFNSKTDGGPVTRVCAPMDFGPSRRTSDKNDRYHLWDYESDAKPHPLSLDPNRIIEMVVLEEGFKPSEFVTWDLAASPWFVKRDWGIYS